MAYRDMQPYQVLIEVIGDIEDAKVRLSLAEAKMMSSGLTDRPGYEEVARFIGAAMRAASRPRRHRQDSGAGATRFAASHRTLGATGAR